ncbi:MAG: efflux transporter outer membrane subunit [Alphaproteobacteria bacterium]|nr:efflux transporter outer membrane subunit [Alphaproteobacteria bacterium]
MQFRRVLLSTSAVLMLSGCLMAHDVNKDVAPLRAGGAAYSMIAADNTALSDAWYRGLGDEKLSALIDHALENNLDIRQAMARLDQAEAIARQSGAQRLPAIDLGANSRKTWEDNDAQAGYSEIGATLEWEADIFNRLGSAAAADRFEAQAFAAEVDAVRLSLTAELAEAYYSAVAQHLQLELLRKQTGTDGKFLELVQQRQTEGLGTRVEVLQQQGQLADTNSLIPVAEASLRVFENRLDVLMGNAPDAFNRTAAEDNFATIGDLPPIGVPSDLLLNRPDLRALRHSLIAADADIGAAIADRLPRVTLTGSYALVDGPGMAMPVASILGSLVQPLLDWGRRKAEVERNQALYEERLAAFSQAYLLAIEDVENALYQENRQREFVTRLEERRRILSETVGSAQEVFKQGLSDYLPVLDALRDLRVVERSLLAERRNLVLFRIALFRAIGAPVSPDQPVEEKS